MQDDSYAGAMNRDLGEPASYLTLAAGTAVYDVRDRHVGHVAHVLAVEELDVFDGIVVVGLGVDAVHRFADADQVSEIYERRVLLKVAWEALHEPGPSPAALEVGADDMVGDDVGDVLSDRLHRAWNLISGNY